ncbi:MAG: 50S ribosomal protein L22 [Patescibacteria group bacterium]
MKAALYRYRQSPRKVRLVANLVAGKRVAEALKQLEFLPKRAALPLAKLIKSAVANAVNNLKMSADHLIVKNLTVDKDVVLKRFRPRARGSASRINKRTSQVRVILAEQVTNKK